MYYNHKSIIFDLFILTNKSSCAIFNIHQYIETRFMNTEQVLIEIGEKIRRHRLNCDLSQKEVAERSGIGLASVARLEDGQGCTLANFIRVLSALNVLESLDAFLPTPPVSPIQLAKLQGKLRQKASRKS